MSLDAIISKLDGVQGRGPAYRAICPAHDSKHKTRSLAVREAEDGRILVKCHAGCDIFSIVGALGMDITDLFPPRIEGDSKPRIKKPWSARDVLAALQGELGVAWIVLADVANGRQVSDGDRQRAGQAQKRIAHLMGELTNAA